MSAKLKLQAKDLKQCFSSLSLIAAKGSQLTPVSVKLANNKLTFTCLQGCVVQSTLEVNCGDSLDIVFMYYDVTPVLPSVDEVYLEIDNDHLSVSGPTFSCAFPNGYGDPVTYDFSDCSYTKFGDLRLKRTRWFSESRIQFFKYLAGTEYLQTTLQSSSKI